MVRVTVTVAPASPWQATQAPPTRMIPGRVPGWRPGLAAGPGAADSVGLR
jgi:hypothetical protein